MSEELKGELAKLTSDLVKINSSNPPGITREVANFLVDYLQLNGFTPDSIEVVEGKANVVVRAGSSPPTIILVGHMDVVPPGSLAGWHRDPFSGAIEDGKVFGRGATDMKGGLAVITRVFVDLASKLESKGVGSLMLVATADEEVGGAAGMKALVEQELVKGDAAIVAEPSGIGSIAIGEKGLCQIALRVRGRPAHGSVPMLGDNAIYKAFQVINVLSEFIGNINSRLRSPSELNDVIEQSSELLIEEVSRQAMRLSAEEARTVLEGITFNLGVMKGGSKVNVVPDLCEAEIDMRLPLSLANMPQRSPCSWLIGEIKSYLPIVLGEESSSVEIEVINESRPNYTPPDSPLVEILSRNVSKVLGRPPRVKVETGATDGRYLRALGIPTVVYGPGEPSLAHAYNEYVLVDDLLVSYKVIAGTVSDLTGLSP